MRTSSTSFRSAMSSGVTSAAKANFATTNRAIQARCRRREGASVDMATRVVAGKKGIVYDILGLGAKALFRSVRHVEDLAYDTRCCLEGRPPCRPSPRAA